MSQQVQTQDRYGLYYRVGDSVSVAAKVLKIDGPKVTVVLEDVGEAGYLPLELTVHPKQTVKGT